MDWTYIDDVLVDVVENENPTFSNEITEKPVEDGSVITDHINNNPTEITLDIIITGEYGVTSEEKYERLLEIRDNRELISVAGALQVYENMAISELSLEKNADNATGYSGSVSLKQIKFATAETIEVEVAPPVIDDEEQSDPEGESSDLSSRDSEDEEVDEETVKNKSLTVKIGEAVLDAIGGDEEWLNSIIYQ